MDQPKVDAVDAVDAHLASKSLRKFIPMAWPIIEPGVVFRSNWHIEVVSEYLEAAAARDIRKLIINVPPRTMKSRLVSVLWPAWVWLTKPETKWLFASYSSDLSTEHSVDCRSLLESGGGREAGGTLLERVGYKGVLEVLGQRWALGPNGEMEAGALGEGWDIAKDQNLKTRYMNSARGYRLATSVTARVTGFGGDIIVADDPHNAMEAESDEIRGKVLKWWDRAITSRMNDPKTGVRVIVMQRLHEKDLTGHLMAMEAGYTHLCLPMEYEPKHPFVCPPHVTLPGGRVLRGDHRTEAGELLWPEHMGPEEVAELKTMGSYAAAGQLQQRPAPDEGGILKRRWWRYFPAGWGPDEWPHFHEVVQSWDMAFKDTDGSDYVVGQVWGRFFADKYLLHQFKDRVEFTETVHALVALTAWVDERLPRHRGHAKLVEDKANGPAVISTLRGKVSGLIPVDPGPLGGKVARARAVAPQIEGGNVYLPGVANSDGSDYDRTMTPGWVQHLVDEAAAFPNASNDDQVDALSQALSRLEGVGGTARARGDAGRSQLGGVRSKAL